MKTRTLATALLLALLLAACSQPQSPAIDERVERLTQYFRGADTDGDGVLSRAEIDTEIDADFDTLDYDGDGVVTIEDVLNEEQGLPDGAEPIQDLSHHLPYDGDDDGTITREEYRSYLESELLAEMDANGDRAISFGEYRTSQGL
jgi:Ca2+-binding EF-hand superfamily protein